ncbi:MAG: transcriptional regulator, TetR family [Sphingobacteriales bacterium]|nr:transcriptional regulator, TetR family [Sphingobacteriales bacterium]
MIVQKDKIEELDRKKEQIIEAALKRFSHFGIPKTTMNEIAEDLSISKALLYYYFPDKISLAYEVAEFIIAEFLKQHELIFENAASCFEGLQDLISFRIAFGKKYFMLHIHDKQTDVSVHDVRAQQFICSLRENELSLITAFLEKAKQNGELKAVDSQEIAKILMDMLTGIWICEMYVNHKTLIPNDQQFHTIKTKMEKIIHVFYEGIKNNNHGTANSK